jgi:hypothetical protein
MSAPDATLVLPVLGRVIAAIGVSVLTHRPRAGVVLLWLGGFSIAAACGLLGVPT